MRISDNQTYDQVRNNLLKNRSDMSNLQNQAATQKRVTKPSDDPVSAGRVLKSRVDFEGNKQYVKNLNYARSFLEMTDQSLGDVSENLMRLKDLALNQANDASASAESRRLVATEVDQIRSQIINIGNRKLGDRFIFGGTQTQTQPFALNGSYQGDDGEMNIHVDKANFLPMNVAGNRVFLGEGLSPDGVVRPSTPQAHTIEEFRRRSLQNPEAEPREPLPPFLRGPSSVSVGTKVDSSTQPISEDESRRLASGVNLFKVAEDLQVALRTNDKAGIQDALEVIDAGLSQVVLARAQIGSRSTAITSLIDSIEKAKVDNKVAISQHEDADVYATISDINKTEATLQATLQTSGKLIQPSLLNFLS